MYALLNTVATQVLFLYKCVKKKEKKGEGESKLRAYSCLVCVWFVRENHLPPRAEERMNNMIICLWLIMQRPFHDRSRMLLSENDVE